jgi:hypothetical protein
MRTLSFSWLCNKLERFLASLGMTIEAPFNKLPREITRQPGKCCHREVNWRSYSRPCRARSLHARRTPPRVAMAMQRRCQDNIGTLDCFGIRAFRIGPGNANPWQSLLRYLPSE